jgi:hypothetical protein
VRGDGLAFAQGAGLGAFQHHGHGHRPLSGGHGDGLHSTGKIPEIFNTDQGCQFTSAEWTGCATTIKAGRRRQLKLPSWDGGFLG